MYGSKFHGANFYASNYYNKRPGEEKKGRFLGPSEHEIEREEEEIMAVIMAFLESDV